MSALSYKYERRGKPPSFLESEVKKRRFYFLALKSSLKKSVIKGKKPHYIELTAGEASIR